MSEPKRIQRTPKVTTTDVMTALRAKYSNKNERAWAGGFYMEECGINGGGPVNSRCDALYAGFTSASGRLLVGHEVKISRADWQAELSKVGKADFWHDNTHQWFIVAPSGMISAAELPDTWGLMELQGSRLVVKVRAPRRDITPSWTALRSILSRAETLRAESVANAQRDAMDNVRQQMADLQHRLRAAEQHAGGPSEVQQRMRRIVATAEQLIREGGHYGAVPEDQVVAALVDSVTVSAATEQARQHLTTLVRDVNRVASGIGAMYGPLKKILDESAKASP